MADKKKVATVTRIAVINRSDDGPEILTYLSPQLVSDLVTSSRRDDRFISITNIDGIIQIINLDRVEEVIIASFDAEEDEDDD